MRSFAPGSIVSTRALFTFSLALLLAALGLGDCCLSHCSLPASAASRPAMLCHEAAPSSGSSLSARLPVCADFSAILSLSTSDGRYASASGSSHSPAPQFIPPFLAVPLSAALPRFAPPGLLDSPSPGVAASPLAPLRL